MKHEILLGLTTTRRSDYQRKVNEIKTFNIKKIAFFPTYLKIDDRKRLYDLLDKSGLEEIVHVHLRGQDMEPWELEMFERRYNAQLFNVHQEDIDAPVLKLYMHKTYIENQFKFLKEENVKKCAGICLDASHAQEGRIWKNSQLDPMHELLEKYPVGCCHISAVKLNKLDIINRMFDVSRHVLRDLADVDYVADFKRYLPQYLSIELENSFEQQLEIKAHLEKILDIV